MADHEHTTEIRWREFAGNELDRKYEPRAYALYMKLRKRGRKLMLGIRFTRIESGPWAGNMRGDCRALWKTARP